MKKKYINRWIAVLGVLAFGVATIAYIIHPSPKVCESEKVKIGVAQEGSKQVAICECTSYTGAGCPLGASDEFKLCATYCVNGYLVGTK